MINTNTELLANKLDFESDIDKKVIAAYNSLQQKNPHHYLLKRLKEVSNTGFKISSMFKADYGSERLDKVRNKGWMNYSSLDKYCQDLYKVVCEKQMIGGKDV